MLTKKTLFLVLLEVCIFKTSAQEDFSVEADFFTGNVLPHDNNLEHLATGHPNGLIISWNKHTNGEEAWQARYNYPDYGLSFIYQNYDNNILGFNASLNAHYNFYFFNRLLMFRISQGLGWSSRPFDRETNPKNIAISTHLNSSTYIMINYKQRNLIDHLGFQTGLTFSHHSIGSIKAPNKGINTIAFNVGLFYDFSQDEREFIPLNKNLDYSRDIRYNLALRSGFNESDVVGSGQYPFFVVSGYAEKKVSPTNGLQLGADLFVSYFLKEFIEFQSLRDDGETNPDTDFKRFSLFAGHELFINELSIISQVGYYLYYPFDYAARYYFRVGLKYYFNDKLFSALTLKSHAANAEAVEFGIGIKL